jgi:hypothetical protein
MYVSPADRARLEGIVADRNSASKHVWRANIVLATADGLGTNAIILKTAINPRRPLLKGRFATLRWSDLSLRRCHEARRIAQPSTIQPGSDGVSQDPGPSIVSRQLLRSVSQST